MYFLLCYNISHGRIPCHPFSVFVPSLGLSGPNKLALYSRQVFQMSHKGGHCMCRGISGIVTEVWVEHLSDSNRNS